MFDRELVQGSLANILAACDKIAERAEGINSGDDFACSPGGMLRLDAVCMNLISIGEAVKGIDKLTRGGLLPKYPKVYWRGVMRMRDKIAHHYFEIDADVVYMTIIEDIPTLRQTVRKMIADIQSC